MSNWNVNSVCVVDVCDDDLPEVLQNKGIDQLEIVFNSQGYYLPAKTYGDPYDCYPEESDDERTLVSIDAYSGDVKIAVDAKTAEGLFEKYLNDVYESSLPEEDYCEPDYDDWED